MSDDKKYNGWTNYETWCVHLWLSNEEGSYNYCRGLADECKEYAVEHEHDIWSPEEHARFRLADMLKESLAEGMDNLKLPASVWSDLLSSALDRVNWNEIANAFLEE